ncbi:MULTISPECIES: TetR/AcrR family transcriptional regulator [Nocardiopsis]|uniref:TetR/AcrR family transcriptional regulator n=1 Tax=Nocardiopsis TaxID=2013 RepID=UPI000346E3BB|nr:MULTISPECIES: TetR/AcrR family transcriptional regulator [Nocardiopsis]
MAPHRRREDLIRTALELFALRSPDRVTPEDVAEAADVSRALVYRYFPNMAELREAALRTAVDELAPRLAPPPDLPVTEQLRTALRAFIAFADAYAPAYTALLRGGSIVATESTESVIDEVRRQVLDLLLERSGAGEPAPRELLAMRCWISTVESAVLIWLQERPMGAEELADWLLDQLLAMTGAAGAGEVETRAAGARVGDRP